MQAPFTTEPALLRYPIELAGRPELLLDPGARRANSSWSFIDPSAQARFVDKLGNDLKAGVWDEKHGKLRHLPFFEGSLRLVVGRR